MSTVYFLNLIHQTGDWLPAPNFQFALNFWQKWHLHLVWILVLYRPPPEAHNTVTFTLQLYESCKNHVPPYIFHGKWTDKFLLPNKKAFLFYLIWKIKYCPSCFCSGDLEQRGNHLVARPLSSKNLNSIFVLSVCLSPSSFEEIVSWRKWWNPIQKWTLALDYQLVDKCDEVAIKWNNNKHSCFLHCITKAPCTFTQSMIRQFLLQRINLLMIRSNYTVIKTQVIKICILFLTS